MMDAVKKGGDRQQLHERVRIHSMEAGKRVKSEGLSNDLLDRIAADEIFMTTREELSGILRPENYVGRAPQQTEEFLRDYVFPAIEKYGETVEADEITV